MLTSPLCQEIHVREASRNMRSWWISLPLKMPAKGLTMILKRQLLQSWRARRAATQRDRLMACAPRVRLEVDLQQFRPHRLGEFLLPVRPRWWTWRLGWSQPSVTTTVTQGCEVGPSRHRRGQHGQPRVFISNILLSVLGVVLLAVHQASHMQDGD